MDRDSGNAIVIAIDGLSAAGKGTIAERVARELGFAHFSSGYIYRVVAFLAVQSGVDVMDPKACGAVIEIAQHLTPDIVFEHIMHREYLETQKISCIASAVAAIGEVRYVLIDIQRDFAKGKNGLVIDGRDIGTVIFPDADFKFFVIASQEVRAKRRYKQLLCGMGDGGNGDENMTLASVLAKLNERDLRDMTRAVAPTIPAEDAVIVDTSNVDVDTSVAYVLDVIKNGANDGVRKIVRC